MIFDIFCVGGMEVSHYTWLKACCKVNSSFLLLSTNYY